MKKYIVRAIISLLLGVVATFFFSMDNTPQDTYYEGYTELYNFIGASLFMACIIFVFLLPSTMKKSDTETENNTKKLEKVQTKLGEQ